MKKRHGVLILLIALVFLGCRKKRFINYDTIIEIVIPKDCDSCVFGIVSDDKIDQFSNIDIWTDDYILSSNNFTVIEENLSFDNTDMHEVTLKWSEFLNNTQINLDDDDIEFDPDHDPTRKLRFILVNNYYDTYFDNNFEYQSNGKVVGNTTKRIKPRKVYRWNPEEGTFKKTGEKTLKNEESSPSNSLSGKWIQVNACSNSAGEKNYFNFSSSSSGTIGQIDCNNSCNDGGVYTQFDYTVSGSNVSITPKSVSDFCGTYPTLASPFTVPFSISGNVLTLDGENFEK